MATISDLAKKVRNTTSRLSSFMIKDKAGDGSYYNMGRIQGAEFTSDPVTSEMDQDGRQSTQLWECTVSFTMQQASNTELSLQEFLALPSDSAYDNGHDIYVTGSKQISTADVGSDPTSMTNPSDPEGILFQNVLLNPSPQINLAGDVALIEVEFTFKLELDGFDTLDTDKTIVASPA